MTERVPNAPFRSAFLRGGAEVAEVCDRMGWRRGNGKPDHTVLRRRLGIRDQVSRTSGRRYTNKTISLDEAERLAVVLGLDPVECGL